MAMKAKPAPAPAPPTPRPPRANPNSFEVSTSTGESNSEALARLLAEGVTSALTLKNYSGAGEGLEVPDLVSAMKLAGDEAVAGNLARTERMLSNQLLVLDAMSNNLAQRAHRQENFKGIETMTRLALKAQAQARATAETLGVLKNPMPFIAKQTNIAHGHQQINNTQSTRTGNFQSEPNELLEAPHGGSNILDTRTATAAGRGHQALEAVESIDRPKKRRGQGAVKS